MRLEFYHLDAADRRSRFEDLIGIETETCLSEATIPVTRRMARVCRKHGPREAGNETRILIVVSGFA